MAPPLELLDRVSSRAEAQNPRPRHCPRPNPSPAPPDSALPQAEIVVISSVSEDYCHIVTPPDVWRVPLRTRLYLGHSHEFHYVSTRPL